MTRRARASSRATSPPTPGFPANVPGHAAEEAQDQRVNYWTADQAGRFLDSVQEGRGPLAGVDTRRLAPFWSFLLGTGARRGEALALRWSDVDLETGAVTLRRSMAMAKDAEGRWTPTYTSPKAGASRTVDLDADLVDTLRWHRKAQEDERDERPGAYEDHGLVFAREDGSHLRPEYVSKLLPRLARTAGVPVIRLHDLRHTHAAVLLSAGVPLFVVSKRLGHKTQAMTSDLYGHLVPGANRAAAQAWADQLRQARQTSES